jgi:hypothetical protein
MQSNNVKQLDIGSWLELTDIKHRYGKFLMKYYRYWLMYEKEEDEDFFKVSTNIISYIQLLVRYSLSLSL